MKYRRKKGSRKSRPKSLAITGGVAMSAIEFATGIPDSSHSSVMNEAGYLITGRQKDPSILIGVAKKQAMNYRTYLPAIGGIVLHKAAVITGANRYLRASGIPIIKRGL